MYTCHWKYVASLKWNNLSQRPCPFPFGFYETQYNTSFMWSSVFCCMLPLEYYIITIWDKLEHWLEHYRMGLETLNGTVYLSERCANTLALHVRQWKPCNEQTKSWQRLDMFSSFKVEDENRLLIQYLPLFEASEHCIHIVFTCKCHNNALRACVPLLYAL